MSVKDFNKCLIVSDALNGDIIDTIDMNLYKPTTIMYMLTNIIDDFVNSSEHGVLIKVGSKR